MKLIATYCFQLFLLLGALLLSVNNASAQAEKKTLRDGNDKYEKGKYGDAEKKYLHAINEKPNYLKGEYNLGNAYYKQGKYSDAISQYETVVRSTNSKDTLGPTFHNLGNSYLKKKDYEKAISAYKNSLKINAKDDSTRYNLAWAQKKLQEQKKQGGGGQDNKENKSGQNNKDEKKDGDGKQELNNKNDEKKENKPQQGAMSKEEAQRMLDALKNNEKKIANGKKHKGENSENTKPEKDW